MGASHLNSIRCGENGSTKCWPQNKDIEMNDRDERNQLKTIDLFFISIHHPAQSNSKNNLYLGQSQDYIVYKQIVGGRENSTLFFVHVFPLHTNFHLWLFTYFVLVGRPPKVYSQNFPSLAVYLFVYYIWYSHFTTLPHSKTDHSNANSLHVTFISAFSLSMGLNNFKRFEMNYQIPYYFIWFILNKLFLWKNTRYVCWHRLLRQHNQHITTPELLKSHASKLYM